MMINFKNILPFLFATTVITGTGHLPASASPKIIQVQACTGIGNIHGKKPLKCIEEGGYSHGKAGRAFREDRPIWLLVRFRELPTGRHNLRVETCRAGQRGRKKKCRSQKIRLNNTSRSWAQYFQVRNRGEGLWRSSVFLKGYSTFDSTGSVRYEVGTPIH